MLTIFPWLHSGPGHTWLPSPLVGLDRPDGAVDTRVLSAWIWHRTSEPSPGHVHGQRLVHRRILKTAIKPLLPNNGLGVLLQLLELLDTARQALVVRVAVDL